MWRQTKNEHLNHEERFAKEEAERGVTTVACGATTDPPIKSKHADNLDKDFVKVKFCWDTTSEKTDQYEFKMALLENGEPEEFLLFICNLNMTIKASETL